MSGEFGTGKTIFVLAIVVGCFAVLWPKIFYPMLTASVKSPASTRQAAVGWKNVANSEFLQQLCYLLEEHSGARWSHEADCWLFLESSCHLELNESMLQDYRLGKDKTSFTDCLGINYGLSPNIVAAAVPPKVRPRSYTPQVPWSYVQGDLKSLDLDDDVIEPWADLKTPRKDGPNIIKSGSAHHVRPERPAHLYPEMMHPALREKGRQLPQRAVDKNPRPGPMPGMRPTMGGAGGIVPPPQGKGSGAMGIIMPLYTVGIVVFFVYTIMKVLFKKGSDDEKAPKLKDFGMDPEYRKYVFAEEYLDNQNISTKSEFRRQQREDSRQRKKMHEVPDTKIDQLLRPTQMDTGGKKLGEWFLPEGFLNKEDNEDDEYLDNHGGTSYNEAMTETVGERLSKFKEEFRRENSEGNLYIPKGYINEDDIKDEEIQDILKDLQQITGGLTIEEAMSESVPGGMRSHSRKGKQNESKASLENFTDSDINAKNLLSFLRKGLDHSDIEHTEWKRLTDLCELAENVVDKRISDNIIDELEEPYEEELENDYLNGIDTEEENMDGSYREDFLNDFEQKDHYQISKNEYNITKDKKEKDQCQLKRIRNKDEMLSFKENFKPEEKLKHHYEISPTFFKGDEALPTIESVDDRDICISKDLQQFRENNESDAEDSNWKQECDKKDEQMDHLRRRLEDTETAMERLMNQMGSVTDKLTAAKITEVLSQAQAQAKILKDEAADLSFASEDDLTTSEALTTTMSDEPSFPSALHRHLQDLQNEEKTSSKDSSPDMEEYEVIQKEGVEKKTCKKQSKESSPISTTETEELKKETENKSSEPASTTITPTMGKQDDMMTTASQKEEEDSLDTTDKTDESLSQISPATVDTTEKVDTAEKVDITEKVDTMDKVESDTSDTLSTVESKKEMPISEKLSSVDLSSTKPVIDEEENSIGKVEE